MHVWLVQLNPQKAPAAEKTSVSEGWACALFCGYRWPARCWMLSAQKCIHCTDTQSLLDKYWRARWLESFLCSDTVKKHVCGILLPLKRWRVKYPRFDGFDTQTKLSIWIWSRREGRATALGENIRGTLHCDWKSRVWSSEWWKGLMKMLLAITSMSIVATIKHSISVHCARLRAPLQIRAFTGNRSINPCVFCP